MEEVFHSGEIAVQHRVNEVAIAKSNGRIITDTIIPGAINFLQKQPMCIVSSVDEVCRIWTSVLIGEVGFIQIPDTKLIEFDQRKIRSTSEDIFYENILKNDSIGSLFIELVTRRRYRVNGRVSIDDSKITLDVEEAYPNCPKYIQTRFIEVSEDSQKIEPLKEPGITLGKPEMEWISQADTFFVGSQNSDGKQDASHRGGKPGFIEVVNHNTLIIPDYKGNSLYNTLGNFVQNPNCGLLFIDFEKGNTLQMTGKAEIIFDRFDENDEQKTGGTGRYWIFKVEKWIRIFHHHKVVSEFLEYSPFNP